jgi:hypothetical protein
VNAAAAAAASYDLVFEQKTRLQYSQVGPNELHWEEGSLLVLVGKAERLSLRQR